MNGGTAARIAAQQFRNGENVVAGLRPGHRPRRSRTGCAVSIALPNRALSHCRLSGGAEYGRIT